METATSVNVQYQYADGSSNTIRPTALVYPDGRVLHYDYGAADGIDDALSRIASLIDNDGTAHLADYTRIGRDTFVEQSSPQPQIAWSLINGTGSDPYSGLDQFNRVVDNRWYSTVTSADLDRIQHGYDRASNRLYRKNTAAEAAGVYLDELYGYDGIYRLKEMPRGQLTGANTAIAAGTLNFAQAWGLDATGNWEQFWENGTGASWSLQQSRAGNPANEITSIVGGGWVRPEYDAAGNMVQVPDSNSPSTADDVAYDAWSRLVLVSFGSSPAQGNGYDGDNRRVTTLVAGTLRHCYYSSQWQNVEERLEATATADRQFIWGLRYIDGLVLRDRGGERFYAIQDPNWNITGIITPRGDVAERYVYEPYGVPVFVSGAFSLRSSSSYDWETLFGAYRFDSALALYSVRMRPYGPAIGCWLSADPIATLGGMNLYAYGASSPINSTDPTGLAPNPGPLVNVLAHIMDYAFFGTSQCYTVVIPTAAAAIVMGVSVCVSADVRNCCIPCGICRTCVIIDIHASAGLYATGSIRPGFNPPLGNWGKPVSIKRIMRQPFKPGKWLNVPFRHGVFGGCPKEGITGRICVVASVGVFSWTAGVRGCVSYPGGDTQWEAGMGIGQGTGVAVQGGSTITKCG